MASIFKLVVNSRFSSSVLIVQIAELLKQAMTSFVLNLPHIRWRLCMKFRFDWSSDFGKDDL